MNADTCQGSSSGDLKTLPNKSSWRCTSMPEAALQRARCTTAVFGIQNSFAASDVASRWLHAFSGAGCCPCMTCDCQLDTAQSDKKKIYRSTGEVSIIRVVSMSIMHLPPTLPFPPFAIARNNTECSLRPLPETIDLSYRIREAEPRTAPSFCQGQNDLALRRPDDSRAGCDDTKLGSTTKETPADRENV